MRRIAIAATIVLFTLAVSRWPGSIRPAMASADIVVMSAADGGPSECPGASCTLRKAIETANVDAGSEALTIGFDATAFPPDSPTTISIGSSPLPPITRAALTIEASGTGVRILGNSQNLSSTTDGLVVAAADVSVRGLAIEHFAGACIRVTGDGATIGGDSGTGQGNRLGNCSIGVAVEAAGAIVGGNAIGFAADDGAAAVDTAMQIAAPNARIGDDGKGAGFPNTIGNAQVAIRVGTGSGTAFAGTRIVRNVIGRNVATAAAPVGRGIEILQPSSGTLVASTSFAYTQTAISVAADAGGVSVTRNSFQQNTFHALGGLAIDLNADGVSNANDDGDADGGGNGGLNHPAIDRAVQSRISGSVGASCAGCAVQLYIVEHQPGSPNDQGSLPVAGGTATADASGAFAIDTPAVTPGQWVAALATDTHGNTSEFGPSVRVGAGVAQCGNVGLVVGWNHVGFFGPETALLGNTFPASGDGAGAVMAIYRLRDGAGNFDHWFTGNGSDRTLTTLEPGDTYWFYAQRPVTLTAGFSLSVPLPVALHAGWNDVVYIGASADVRDALATVAGKYSNLFRWSASGSWATYGAADTPTWAREFTTLETCSAYELFVTTPGVLTPLQP